MKLSQVAAFVVLLLVFTIPEETEAVPPLWFARIAAALGKKLLKNAIIFHYNHYFGFLFNLDRGPHENQLHLMWLTSSCNPATLSGHFVVLVRLLSRLLVHGPPSLQMMTSLCPRLSGVLLMICLTVLSVSMATC